MKKRLLQLAVEWKRRATELRALRPQQMQAAGISPRTRDYAVVHYEDRADEIERIIQSGE